VPCEFLYYWCFHSFLFLCVIRLHRLHVAWSVCLSECLMCLQMGELCKNGRVDRGALWGLTQCGSRNHLLGEGPDRMNTFTSAKVTRRWCGLLPNYFRLLFILLTGAYTRISRLQLSIAAGAYGAQFSRLQCVIRCTCSPLVSNFQIELVLHPGSQMSMIGHWFACGWHVEHEPSVSSGSY